mmetsp:Transcript_8942/g.28220  ORF Transcript_8942/g.28220 Transcript_8942/m.28220 type:complete len:273 (-) Transcript_8942:706-1524(-)
MHVGVLLAQPAQLVRRQRRHLLPHALQGTPCSERASQTQQATHFIELVAPEPRAEQVGVVGSLSQLRESMRRAAATPAATTTEGAAKRAHALVVQGSLLWEQVQQHHTLALGHQLAEHVLLAPTQHERAQHLPNTRQPFASHLRLSRPLLEQCHQPPVGRVEHVRQREAEQRQQLHQVVLDRGAAQQDASLGAQRPQPTVARRHRVLDAVRFVQHQVRETKSAQEGAVRGAVGALEHCVGGQQEVELAVSAAPQLALQLQTLSLGPVVDSGA